MSETLKSVYPTTPNYTSATHRWKFQQRPLVPLAPIYHQTTLTTAPSFKTSSTQTTYRESDTQTDPFTAPLVARAPELEATAELRWGKGLPATEDEYEYIRRVLVKKKKMDNLPLNLRDKLKALRTLEVDEAEYRASVGERLIQEKVDVLSQFLEKKHEDRIKNMEVRMREYEKLKHELYEEKKGSMERRKELVLSSVLDKKKVLDISNLDKRISAYQRSLQESERAKTILSVIVNNVDLDTSKSLKSPREPKYVAAVERLTNPSETSYKMQAEKRWRVKLEQLATKAKVTEKESTVQSFLVRKEKKAERPKTPIKQDRSKEEEELEEKAVLIQRLLRGLYELKLMETGVGKRRDLLDELETRRNVGTLFSLDQLSNSLADIPQKIQSIVTESQSNIVQEQPAGISKQSIKLEPTVSVKPEPESPTTDKNENQSETIRDKFAEMIIAPYIGRCLDYLSKEVVRTRELAFINVFIAQARVTRDLREKEESEKRGRELEIRKRVNRLHEIISGVAYESAETLSDDVVGNMISTVATVEAYGDAEKKVQYVKDEKDEDVVKSLNAFLLEELEKRIKDTKEERVRKRALEFVAESLEDTIK